MENGAKRLKEEKRKWKVENGVKKMKEKKGKDDAQFLGLKFAAVMNRRHIAPSELPVYRKRNRLVVIAPAELSV